MARAGAILIKTVSGNRFLRYAGWRAVFFVPQLVGVTFVTFFVVRLLPGDPASRFLGSLATPDQLEAFRERLGLNKPIWEQYVTWMGDLLHGNLGVSFFTGNPVRDDITDRFPITLELITISLIISLLIMIPLGILSARQTGGAVSRWANRTIFSYGMLAGALPDFWLALILIFIFYTQLGWAPAPLGQLDAGIAAPDRITGFLTIDSLLRGDLEAFQSAVRHLALPVVTLVFVYGGPILKMTRGTIAGMLDSPYVEHARALGLSESKVLFYAFRNSLPPVITMTGIIFGYLLGGAVLVETVFSWGGFGQYAVQSVLNADFNGIQGFVIVAAIFSIVVYLLVDVAYVLIDPRIGQ
jgi:ABC-type dipeptide/oligopeptide/nickel transport system permease component